MSVRALAALLAATALGGCAGFTTVNIDSEADDLEARGFRYYESAPFLLIHTDSKGGITSEVLFLPDTTKKRSIRPYAYAASNKSFLKFTEGRLTQAKAVVDETGVPLAAIAELEKLAKAAMRTVDPADGPKHLPAPYLFRIVKTGERWSLNGGQAIRADGTPSRIDFTAP